MSDDWNCIQCGAPEDASTTIETLQILLENARKLEKETAFKCNAMLEERGTTIEALQAQVAELEHWKAEARIAELESPWISVDTRLPEIDSRFLIYDSYYTDKRNDTGHCMQLGRMTKSWGIAPSGMNGKCSTVTHWMPLPPPPEPPK